jgi:translation initiation factor IF-3
LGGSGPKSESLPSAKAGRAGSRALRQNSALRRSQTTPSPSSKPPPRRSDSRKVERPEAVDVDVVDVDVVDRPRHSGVSNYGFFDRLWIGIMDLAAAINLARQSAVDLVEIAATAVPPVCRIVDYGKFKYELSKKERDSKKHQAVNLVKEVQLSPRIDPHDLGIKREHTIGFLCEDMKVKATLRFRGREMAHTEVGKEVMNKFLEQLAPWGHPDFPPKLVGKAINVMISPLPKNKRAKNPKEVDLEPPIKETEKPASNGKPQPVRVSTDAASQSDSFGQNPFSSLSVPTEG